MIFEDVPWVFVLPALVPLAFVGGLILYRMLVRTVRVIRNTIRPGELHVDELRAYAAKRVGKTA